MRNLTWKWLALLVWLGLNPRTFALLSVLVSLLWLGCNPLDPNSWQFLCLVVFIVFSSLKCTLHPWWHIPACIRISTYCFSGFSGPSYSLRWSTLFVAMILVSWSKIPCNCILGCYHLYWFLMENSRTLVLSLLGFAP